MMQVTVVPLDGARLEAARAIDGLSQATVRLLAGDMGRPDRRCFAAVDGHGDVVGVTSVAVAAGEAHVLDLAVRADCRRRGVGRALLAALLGAARDELAATAATLEVRASNRAAQALYRRVGFEPTGVRRGYYETEPGGPREDALIMWLHDLADGQDADGEDEA